MRLLINAQTADADWNVLTGTALTSDETFFTEVISDALGRPRSSDTGRITSAGTEHNVTTHTYGKDGALKTVDVTGSGNYVQDIHHNAKGQREAIWYGNGTKTKYRYDHLTQRLKRLCTVRLSDGKKLQDLCYHYDPVGNITRITDAAQEDVWFANTIVSPKNEYTYDAIYRLIKAEGREKKATASFGAADNSDDSRAMVGAPARWDGGGNALQRYTQYYSYDAVGNILQLQHSAAVGSYTRSYTYVAGSNRLLSTTVGSTTYPCTHDVRGNMTGLPHLGAMDYDLLNQMRHVTAGTSVNAYYQYSGGERTRKWVDKSGGIVEERIYFGSYEVYRKWSSSSVSVERTTLHVGDDAGRVAMIEKRTVGTALADNDTAAELKRFIYSNHLQSAALELDETGAILSYEEYHPYGTTAYQATNTAIKAVAKRYRFTGKERDEESGLNYHGLRYYIPWLCRWGANDPLEDEYTPNSPYQYSLCDPINGSDPSGAATESNKKSQDPAKPAERATVQEDGSVVYDHWETRDGQDVHVYRYQSSTMDTTDSGGTASPESTSKSNGSAESNSQSAPLNEKKNAVKQHPNKRHQSPTPTNSLSWSSGTGTLAHGPGTPAQQAGQAKPRSASSPGNHESRLISIGKEVLKFVPIVGGSMDIYEGIKKRDWKQIAGGAASIVLDVVFAGEGTVIKGVASNIAKRLASPGVRSFFKKAAGGVTSFASSVIGFVQKSQRHHIIPQQIFRQNKALLKSAGWVQNHSKNLIDLPVPFHGWHPAYNNYVRQEVTNLLSRSKNVLHDMVQLENRLRAEIEQIYKAGQHTRLNHHYKALGF